jgi:hypothetical protein
VRVGGARKTPGSLRTDRLAGTRRKPPLPHRLSRDDQAHVMDCTPCQTVVRSGALPACHACSYARFCAGDLRQGRVRAPQGPAAGLAIRRTSRSGRALPEVPAHESSRAKRRRHGPRHGSSALRVAREVAHFRGRGSSRGRTARPRPREQGTAGALHRRRVGCGTGEKGCAPTAPRSFSS